MKNWRDVLQKKVIYLSVKGVMLVVQRFGIQNQMSVFRIIFTESGFMGI